ncbi:hypothetical protein A2U01_0107785, partial [Trifolium medium]|nr:hypothetical protein [Trifolium medium]
NFSGEWMPDENQTGRIGVMDVERIH